MTKTLIAQLSTTDLDAFLASIFPNQKITASTTEPRGCSSITLPTAESEILRTKLTRKAIPSGWKMPANHKAGPSCNGCGSHLDADGECHECGQMG